MPLQWLQAPDAPWSARRDHASTVTPDGRIWVLGGRGDNDYRDVWYSANGSSWTQATSAAGWSARYDHTSVATPDGRIWVIGGWSGSYKNDVWYSTNGSSWTQATSAASWTARFDHTSVVTSDGRIWVISGYTNNGFPSDVWYSSDGSSWTQATSAAPWIGRYDHTSVVTSDDRIWVLGGQNNNYGSRRDVWYSYDGATWTQALEAAPWGSRYRHASVVTSDGRMWVLGGYEGGARNDVWYSHDGVSWTQDTASAQWCARTDHAAVAKNTGIYILGGYDLNNSKPLNDVWVAEIYSPSFTTQLIISNPVSFTAATCCKVHSTSTTVAAVKIYIDEPGIERTLGVPRANHRGHHIIRGGVTIYGRLPQQFGEALIYDHTLSSVTSKFALALEIIGETSFASSLLVGVYNQTEEEVAIRLAVHNPVETTASIKLQAYNPITLSGATKQAVSNTVETAGRIKLAIGTPKSSSAAARLEVWNAFTGTFAVEVDVIPASRPVEYSYALSVKIGTPTSLQAATKQKVYNAKTSTYSTKQTVYTRVVYTAATQQRILAVSPWASSFALEVSVCNPQTAEYSVSVETVPTGKGEGVLEYTVIPPNTSACVDIVAGQGLVIERLPGIVKVTYRGPDGPVELVASYGWQAGVELPVAFRWTPAGCALFVAKAKRAESSVPMLIGERIADIQIGNAQYKDIRVSVRAREDWELAQDIRVMDQDTLVFASQPSQAQVQLITPTIFPQGSLFLVYPYDGMNYCVYEGEDGWLKLNYDDSDWDEAVRVRMDGLADYVWSPGGSRFMYYRKEIYPHNVQDAVYLWIISQDAVFTVYVNGVEVLQGTRSGYEYQWSCAFQDEPKPGLFGEGWNTFCIKAEATGSNPGVRYQLIGRSGFQTYEIAYSAVGDKVMGRKKPVWGAWQAVSGPVITVDPGKALRLRSPDSRSVKVLSWKDEDESIARVNLTPVGR